MIITPSFTFAAESGSSDVSGSDTSSSPNNNSPENDADTISFNDSSEEQNISSDSPNEGEPNIEEDDLLEDEPELQSMSLFSMVNTPAIDFPTSPSETLGYANDSFLTSLFSGAAVYTYPISVPQGVNNFQPYIELVYNSQSVGDSYGWLGSGWSLNEYYILRDINFTPNDVSDDKFQLIFNGQAHNLIYDEKDGFYHTEIETYAKIQKMNGGTNQKGEYWTLQIKDGTTYQFGFTKDSEFLNSASGINYALAWKLNQIKDLNGNLISYNYIKDSTEGEAGPSYLSNITYNSGLNVIEFERITKPIVFDDSAADTTSAEKVLLDSIIIKSDASSVFTYKINYDSSASGISLNSIAFYANNPEDSYVTSFNYTSAGSTSFIHSIIDVSGHVPNGSNYKIMDINGDGLSDIIQSESSGQGNTHYKLWINDGNNNFVYSSNTVSKETFPDFSSSTGNDTNCKIMDINGDGLPDVTRSELRGKEDTFYELWINDGTNNFVYSSNTVSRKIFPDFFSPVSSSSSVTITTPGFTVTSSSSGDSSRDTNCKIMDINGDGLPDVIRSESVGQDNTLYELWINDGNNGFIYSTDTVSKNTFPDFSFSSIDGGRSSSSSSTGSFGGVSGGSNSSANGSSIDDTNCKIMDINDDDLPDVIRSKSDGQGNTLYELWVNDGTNRFTYFTNTVSRSAFPDFSSSSGNDLNYQIMDINGDGLPDVLRSNDDGQDNTHYELWINDGNYGFVYSVNTVSKETFPDFSSSSWHNTNSKIMDMNGDGFPDVIRSGSNGIELWSNSGSTPFLLRQIKHSSGAVTKIEYEISTKIDNTKEDGTQGLPTPVKVVKKVVIDNGMTNDQHTVSTYTYDYEGGLMNFETGQSEFRGFKKVTVNGGRSVAEHYFHQDGARKGTEYKTVLKSISGNLYSVTENTYPLSETGESDKIFEVLMTNSVVSLYDGQNSPIISEAIYEYDSYGNPTLILDKGDLSIDGDENTVLLEYAYNVNSWILDSVVKETLLDSKNKKVAELSFYYDRNSNLNAIPSRGLITKIVYWNNYGNDIVKEFEYDSYGHLISQTDDNGHITTVAYDPNNHIYPVSITNALGQKTSMEVNFSLGTLEKVTDPNGFEIAYEYDDFGRVTKVILPGDSSESPTFLYQYFIDGTAPEHIQISVKETDGQYFDSWKYYDGFERVIKTESESENVAKNIIQETYFNNFGDISAIVAPRTVDESSLKTIIAYDTFGRLTQFTFPDGTSKKVEYNQLITTTTDERGNKIQSEKDIYGNIILVREFNGDETYNTAYEYDTVNRLTKIKLNPSYDQSTISLMVESGEVIDENNVENSAIFNYPPDTSIVELDLSSLGGSKPINTEYNTGEISFTYDSLGRQIGLNDPDLGVWTYEYNSNGKLKSQTDARGVVTTYKYDALDRAIEIGYQNDSNITFEYDHETIGELTKVTSGITEKSYTYDERFRITSETITVDGIDYTTSYVYDSMDRIVQKTLPTGEIVRFVYNNQSLLSSIPGVIDHISYNSMNLMTQKKFANGVSTDLTYDGWSMRLANIYTPGLQDIKYSFDEKGNVIGITDNISSENQYFFYDDLDRLLLTSSENYTQSFAYNSHGSILAHRSKDKITGDEVVFGFEYGNGAGIHAPTRVGDTELFYDANGNLIEDGSFTYAYNDANQLVEVSKKAENRVIAEFFYDESGNRVKKVEDGVVSYYITKDYDIEDGEETVYYYANGDRIARSSNDETFWYLDDHLGSTNVMVDANGELVEKTLYYPFGSVREGGTEKYTFTGKEFDSEIGLYYYGTRYYNPQTFVFTQADTMIPDVYYPQSLNRYAYCYNNPVRYTDPDGHTPLLVTAAIGAGVGALISGTVSAVVQYAETGQVNWKVVGKDAAVGALTGGLIGLTCGAGSLFFSGGGVAVAVQAYAVDAAIGSTISMIGGAVDRAATEYFFNGGTFGKSLDAAGDTTSLHYDLLTGAIVIPAPAKKMGAVAGKMAQPASKYFKVSEEKVVDLIETALVSSGANLAYEVASEGAQHFKASIINSASQTITSVNNVVSNSITSSKNVVSNSITSANNFVNNSVNYLQSKGSSAINYLKSIF